MVAEKYSDHNHDHHNDDDMMPSCLVVLVGEMKICASCAVAVEVERFHLQIKAHGYWSGHDIDIDIDIMLYPLKLNDLA